MSINTNIEIMAFRHHSFPITSRDKLMIQMPSSSDLVEHASDLKHSKQSLNAKDGFQKVQQDHQTNGFSMLQELAWHRNFKRSINSIKKQVKKVQKFQARQRASSVEYASGTCCAVPSKTYAEPELVVMDWALFRVESGQLLYGRAPSNEFSNSCDRRVEFRDQHTLVTTTVGRNLTHDPWLKNAGGKCSFIENLES